MEGVELDGNSHLRLHLLKKGDDYFSPHLQTGSLTYDIPKDSKGFWPFGKFEQPKFMHRYGFYEVRCRHNRNAGWHAAFWLQAPGIGSTPDPRRAGIECDIMENYPLHLQGEVICGNIWGGYGKDCKAEPKHFRIPTDTSSEIWHYYGVDWSPEGYVFYADGKEVGRQESPVSEVEQFILLSTECHGYRGAGFGMKKEPHEPGTPAPMLKKAQLPDYFEVDFVRVFDQVT